jgi:hypothetical protein
MAPAGPQPQSILATSPSDFSNRLTLNRYPEHLKGSYPWSALSKVTLFSRAQVVRDHPTIFTEGISHLTTDPPSITNRGLLMSLNVFELKSPRPGVPDALYAWTFYMAEERFVCAILNPHRVDTDTVYLRIGDLQLVSSAEVENAQLRRIFLALEPVGPGYSPHVLQESEEPTLVLGGISSS